MNKIMARLAEATRIYSFIITAERESVLGCLYKPGFKTPADGPRLMAKTRMEDHMTWWPCIFPLSLSPPVQRQGGLAVPPMEKDSQLFTMRISAF